jgi:hypothetical protein
VTPAEQEDMSAVVKLVDDTIARQRRQYYAIKHRYKKLVPRPWHELVLLMTRGW